MSLYLLDTNIVSKFLRVDNMLLRNRIAEKPPADICISVVTQAEILYGLEKRGNPKAMVASTNDYFQLNLVLPWLPDTAFAFARLKHASMSRGIGIAPLDLMIAAQALAAGAILVTNDSAMKRLAPWLPVEDWTI